MSSIDSKSENAERPSATGNFLRAFRSLAFSILTIAVLLFLPAGDIWWWQGWVFVFVLLALLIVSSVYLRFRNPEIFIARSRIQAGTRTWDKAILVLLFGSLLAILPVAGFDHRYQWSLVPCWLVVVGYALFTLGYLMSTWVYSVNKFAEPGVRIQTEREHKVIDTGPYAIVRHPLYLFSIFLFVGISLALESLWALVPTAIGTIVLFVRTALEDRMLHDELDGYEEYATRVRHRLIPGVW